MLPARKKVWLTGLAAAVLLQAAPQPPITLTAPAAPIERSAGASVRDVYLLPLAAGEYARIEVLQAEVDVTLEFFDPAGRKLLEVDSSNGTRGPEPLSWVAEEPGSYRLEVTTDAHQRTGKYRATLLEKHPALPSDRELASAEKDAAEARQLQMKRSAESRPAARSKYERAIAVFARAGRVYQQGLGVYALGTIAAESGDTARALAAFYQAERLFQDAKDAHMLTAVQISAGAMLDLLGQPQKALDLYNQVLQRARAEDDTVRIGTALNNIAKLHYDAGDWQAAIEGYREALELHRSGSGLAQQAYALNNIGRCYLSLGQPERALELFEEALPLRRAAGDRRGEAETLQSLAAAHQQLQQLPAAAETLDRCLSVRRTLGDRRGEGFTLAALGIVQSRMGQAGPAAKSLAEALQLARATSDRRVEAIALTNLAEHSLRAAQPLRAEEHAGRALTIYRELESRPGAEQALEQLARAESEQGKLVQARAHMEELLALIELNRSRAESEQLRTSFFANRQEAYGFYIGLLMRAYAAAPDPALLTRAFETSERARARGLVEMLAESGTDPRRDADPALLRRQQEITQLLNTKGSRLFAMTNPGSAAGAALKREIRELELEAGEVEAAVRRSSPRYAAMVQPSGLSLEQARRTLLDDDTAVLEFTLAEPHSYLWIADRSGLAFRELPPRAEIETAVRQSLQMVAARQDAAAAEAGRRLSEMLFGAAMPVAAGRRLAIVPDGALQTVPFAMLPAPGGSTPLLVRHEVVTLPSLAALAALRQEADSRKPAPKTVAVFADPVFEAEPTLAKSDSRILEHLTDTPATGTARVRIPPIPYTLKEADEILRSAGSPATSLRAVGVKASREAALDRSLGEYRYIHFATHGLLDAERPSLSALVLSQVDAQKRPVDGFLRVNDVYGLRLNADLVVLSACQTGLGKEVRGEGILGLTRAFMYAGAPRVIVSLWNVNDRATATLMGSMYRKMLRDGQRPAEALRGAQLELRQQKRWSSPYYWAAFQLQGDWK